MIDIVIIEDNLPLAEAYAEIINNSEKFRVSRIFKSVEKLEENIEDLNADIFLMDITLSGINGVEGTRIIKKKLPNTLVIIVTVHENSRIVFDALCAGATGYLTKNLDPEELINALEESIIGGAPMSIKIAKMVVSSFQSKPSKIKLTKKEKNVLQLLADGNTYNNIANQLEISKNTVKFHLKNIYIKLQVNSNVEAVQKANEEKLI